MRFRIIMYGEVEPQGRRATWLGSVLAISLLCAAAMASGDDRWRGMAGMKKLPRFPGARLLVGYAPGTLVVTSPDSTWVVVDDERGRFQHIEPTLALDGKLVAAAMVIGVVEKKNALDSDLLSMGTYSVPEGKWTQYGIELGTYFKGNIAIAPDGSKLAYASVNPKDAPPVQMHVLERRSGTERRYPIQGRTHNRQINVSWSPDGQHIAYNSNSTSPYVSSLEYKPEIWILNLRTEESRKIAQGTMPVWSPSGEWICYLGRPDIHEYPTQVWLVRPDGTGARLLREVGKTRVHLFPPVTAEGGFNFAPVWSPDSKTILLVEWRDLDAGTVDIYLLDIATRKVTTKIKGGPPVYGWAPSN